MAKKDMFAGIAAGGSGDRREQLVETLPLPKSTEQFKKTDEIFPKIIEKTYDEKLRGYYSGIEELKKYYAPFLERKCGSPKTSRTKTNIKDFRFWFEGKESENIEIPHYTGPKGRWTAYYETDFYCDKPDSERRVFLVFKGVDYYADVYLNDNHVCSHEGFFAPFECDVTDFLKNKNKLLVKVGNDIPTIGNGDMQVNGDKLYAATGLGWDDPEDGWHHCPAGGGIFDQVYLEERDSLFIEDIFIRPDIDSGNVEVNISVSSPEESNTELTIVSNIMPYNFTGNESKEVSMTVKAGYGLNFYKFTTELENFRLWEPDSPCMYLCRVTVGSDTIERTFGMRKFHMDTDTEPKGSLYLNNEPVNLRGANEMGHLQLCVMRDDYDQLIEDILIARYCNMNYYRITQRPVQEEIYHYCDMLGMMNQVDLPLFGYMRKNKFHEGVKQAGEMERLVRNHPSVIMATYINEPFAPDKYGLGYRHMSRPELELFFDACDAAVYFENPDRVIKRVEGDYDPPTNEGMSDFHCYNMWYTNHAIPIGMLYKGYLPALKEGWKTGCGEYGAEGLDNYEVMRKYYPSEWLPGDDNDKWLPDKIVKAQSNTMHGDWYEAQDNIRDWINESQIHQAFATELMTLAMRRRSDRIVSTAIHLLIDAWPSGWMKTLLDVDRVPKKAYFSFKESLEPLKINLRCDRWSAYEGETLGIEAWILNDGKAVENLIADATVYVGDDIIGSYTYGIMEAAACCSVNSAVIPVQIPKVETIGRMSVHISLKKECETVSQDHETVSRKYETVSQDKFTVAIYPEPRVKVRSFPIGESAKSLVQSTPGLVMTDLAEAECAVISSSSEFSGFDFEKNIKRVFMTPEDEEKAYEVHGAKYSFETIFDPDEVGENQELKGLSFVALSDKLSEQIDKKALSYLYNSEKDFIDHVAEYYVDGVFDSINAFGYEKPAWGHQTVGEKKKLPVAAIKDNSIFLSMETNGRSGCNPALDKLIMLMLTGDCD